MNLKRLSILVSAIVIFVFSELFPPWDYEYELDYGTGYTTNGRCTAGYSFVTRPPKIRDYNEMIILCHVGSDGYLGEIKVCKNIETLNVQRSIFSSIIVGILLRYFARNKKYILVLGNIILVSTLVILVLYFLLLYFTDSLYFAK